MAVCLQEEVQTKAAPPLQSKKTGLVWCRQHQLLLHVGWSRPATSGHVDGLCCLICEMGRITHYTN